MLTTFQESWSQSCHWIDAVYCFRIRSRWPPLIFLRKQSGKRGCILVEPACQRTNGLCGEAPCQSWWSSEDTRAHRWPTSPDWGWQDPDNADSPSNGSNRDQTGEPPTLPNNSHIGFIYFFWPIVFHYIYFLLITNQHGAEETYWNIKELNLCTVPGTDCSLKLQQREFIECRHCCCEPCEDGWK